MENAILSPDSQTLLRGVFGLYDDDAWVAWKGNWTGKRVRDLVAGDLPGDTDCYFCPALLKDSALTRSNENAERVYALVIDDVGTKIDREAFDMLFPLEPSFIVESSQGNYQYLFFIEGGMAVADYVAMRRAMKTNPVWGHSDGVDPVHLFRLPQGTNTKDRAAGWSVRT